MVVNRIIDESYFNGQLFLPGIGGRINQERLNTVIDDRQAEFLDKALGYNLSAAFQIGITTDPIDQRWLDLRDGKTFVDAFGRTHKWVGFQNGQKKSPLANYVYYWFTRDNATITTTSGEAKPSKENAANVSYIPKQVRAWNDMVRMLDGLKTYLFVSNQADTPLYPEWAMTWQHDITCSFPDIFYRINEFNI